MLQDKAKAALQITYLLNQGVLVEDGSTKIIQIHPHLYKEINKPIPGSIKMNTVRAKELAPAYIEIWPKGISSGGRSVRQGPVAITKKLAVYINKHIDHTNEQILDAAQRYVNFMQTKQYDYMTCSDYFIEKSQNSLLESYICNPELNAKVKPAQSGRMERML